MTSVSLVVILLAGCSATPQDAASRPITPDGSGQGDGGASVVDVPGSVVTPDPTPIPEPTPTPDPVPTPVPSGVDPTGDTIPDTNYPIPSGAVFMAVDGNDANPGTKSAPVKSIRRAVALTPTGGTIVLRGGEHRTWYSNAAGTSYDGVNKSLTIQGYPHEQAWFNGADVVTGWTASGSGRWSLPWSTPTFCDGKYYTYPPTEQSTSNTGPCSHYDMARDPKHPVAGDPQMLFIDGVNQRQVGTLAEVKPGTFHYDWSKRILTMGTNPAGRSVEASARPVALILGNNQDFTVRGVGFHRYGSNQYSNLTGATVYMGSRKAVVENTVFSHNAGMGLTLSTPRPGSSINRSVFAYNGANGLGANGNSRDGSRNDLMIENNVFSGNNFEFFGDGCVASCGAGNMKLTRMVGFTVSRNVIENAFGSEGTGFWCDINCSDGVMVNNLVRGNGNYGIFYEISRGGIIASNMVVNNGNRAIMVGSATTKIYNNTVVFDARNQPMAQGISVYDDSRWPNNPPETGPNTADIEVVNNVVSGATGILMILHDGPGANNTKAAQFIARLDYNAYHHNVGQNIISWADSQAGNFIKSLTDFKARTGLDQNGLDFAGGVDPFFVNSAAGDFRARPGGQLIDTGAALPADVARAIGATPGVPVNRGALSWADATW